MMHARTRGVRRAAMLVIVLLVLLSACSGVSLTAAPQPAASPTAQPSAIPTSTPDPDIVAFPNGHTLRGAFRSFWQAHHGSRVFGAPLTAVLWIDGAWVQHFERARFEQRPDGTISLGMIGSEELATQRVTPPAQTPHDSKACRYFAATEQNVCGSFLDFWQAHGGEPIFGLPLSQTITRGRQRVQYFERARFDEAISGTIELAPLGDAVLSRVPGHAVLRLPAIQPAPQQARLRSDQRTVAPLDPVQATLETDPISGTAMLIWGDTRGHTWLASASLTDGRAEVERMAQGALGAQGAVILIDGRVAGVSMDVYQIDAVTTISTGQPRFDELIGRVKAFMDQDISEYTFGDRTVRGYRSPDNNLLWLRDHVHQGKGYAYWEQDMISLLDQFRRYQRADGSFDDYLGNFEFGEVRGRKEVEADLEYLFVEGVYRAWQATGDDVWLREQINAMERGLRYATSDPRRWDATNRLIKRPYTIDTWDFEIGQPTTSPDGKIAPRHWIDDQTMWSIFHGDNTGYAQAMELLARMHTQLGNADRATYWRNEARGIVDRLNAIAWNGQFFRHMVPLEPVAVPGDTEQQLSLSNAYALNRGVLTAEQGRAIVAAYQARRRPPDQAFAEWYSIDPPFPTGTTSMPEGTKGRNPGEYVNGGIMPLVGGELAQGAFRFGDEAYGFDILQRYYNLIEGTGASYLWYYPLGQPGVSGADTLPTDGWGASAMLAALIEGAAGVRDEGAAFSHATIAPRWSAAPDVSNASVIVRYGAGDGYVAYSWQRAATSVQLTWTGSGSAAALRVLLPQSAPDQIELVLNNQPQTPTIITVGTSRYVELMAAPSGALLIRW